MILIRKLLESSAAYDVYKRITSHSFRIGYISQLWKDTKDIEFVKQTIGHRSLNSTSGYVSNMTDQERQNRISGISK